MNSEVLVMSELSMEAESKDTLVVRPRNIALSGREPLTPNLYPSSIAKIYACGTCSMTFKTRADLYTHNKNVHNHRLFSCEFCDKLFTRSSSLRTHLRVHTGERPYQCSECGKCFTQLSNVLQHNRDVHIRDKRFKCTLCGRGFSRLETLQCHIRVHTGERIYKCSICERTFSQRANLKVHMRIHRGEKTRPLREVSMSLTQTRPLREVSMSLTQPLWSTSRPDISVTNSLTNQLVITAVSGSSPLPQDTTPYTLNTVHGSGGYPTMPPLSLHSPTMLPHTSKVIPALLSIPHSPTMQLQSPTIQMQLQSPTMLSQSPTLLPHSPINNYIDTVLAHVRREDDVDYRPFLCVAAINLLFAVTVTSLIYDRLESRIKENLSQLLREEEGQMY